MAIGDSNRSSKTTGIGSNRGPISSAAEKKGKKPEGPSSSSHENEYYIGAENKRPEFPRRRRFWGRIIRHFKRFWICYGFLGFILLAIFLPVFFLVILPAIAQRLVDNYHIPIYSAEVIDPTPNSITFSLATALDVPLGFSVRIDPFNLSLFNRDVQPVQPYVMIPVPGYNLKKQTNITVTNLTTKILNEDQFTLFLANAVYAKTFRLSAQGTTTAHLGALKVKLRLNTDIELNGLNMLKGFSIDSAGILLPAEADRTNLVGSATLPNYSVVTFGLGNVTLNLMAGNLVIGYGTIDNVYLKPGNNTVPLRGNLDLKTVIQNVGKILAVESTAIGQGNLALSASGNSTVYNGVHIPYFEKVLNNLTITAQVPVLQVLIDTLEGLLAANSTPLQNVTSQLKEITVPPHIL